MKRPTPAPEPPPSFLDELLGRDAGTAQPWGVDRCPRCGDPIVPGQHSSGVCLACTWGRPGEAGSPWRWTKGEVHTSAELPGYASPTVPFSHQVKAELLGAGHAHFAYLMEFGTGKTKVIADEWAAYHAAKEPEDLAVVAPAGVYLGWARELRTHLPPELFERALLMAWISGKGVCMARWGRDGSLRWERTEALTHAGRPRILLVNGEALSTVDRAEAALAELLGRRATLAADEATMFRNPDASRTETMLRLGPGAAHRRIATGLPTPRSPLDLFGQFTFLDPHVLGFQSFVGFRARYAITRTVERPGSGRRQVIVVGYRHIDELRDRILPVSFRVQKDDCLDLPPKLYEQLDVELTDEQRRIYDELQANATAQLDALGAYVTAPDIMVRRLRLLQVADGVVKDEEGNEHALPSNRLPMLMDLLEDFDGKAIIYAPWHAQLHELWRELPRRWGKKSTVRFWGEVGLTEKEEAVLRFQEDAGVRWMVANQSSLGRGRTLTKASLVVYYGNSDDLEVRLNSEDRPHRIGLQHPVTYIDMVAPGTVQERQIASFRAKMDMAALVMGEEPRRWLV